MEKRNLIVIHGLGLSARVGVPEEERAVPQCLKVDIEMEPARSLRKLGDDLELTVDYDAVAKFVRGLAATGERKLIETLAEEIGEKLVARFPLSRVRVVLHKFILPDVESVAVSVTIDSGATT